MDLTKGSESHTRGDLNKLVRKINSRDYTTFFFNNAYRNEINVPRLGGAPADLVTPALFRLTRESLIPKFPRGPLPLQESFRMGFSTVAIIVEEVCTSIWDRLQPLYMPEPTQELWEKSILGYKSLWQFPNCLGSIDGKHTNQYQGQSANQVECRLSRLLSNGEVIFFRVLPRSSKLT
ncbi:hypothetical protein NQ318_010591 [Aromia moschata]|uniref:Reverse transcriptase n=1 Tax=Aromia moschata TaxID=1265417 RepID=A0AAV8X476_9CUCU|nr:hypothetical protein NQ318_010591 [Aromia moschata]